MRKMKAMRLVKPAPVESAPLVVDDVPLPRPGPGQIRLRVNVCGICHTDLHIIEGELEVPRLPLIPGHQVIGTVEARGAGARRFREGDRLGVAWLQGACGTCGFCRRGRENLCGNARFTGFHADGGYAEYLVVREDFAYALPEKFADVQAAPLLCAGVIGYRAFRLAGTGVGERLGLFGFGASAHIVLQVALHRQCEVYVFTRSENHRDLARRMGAAWVGGAVDSPPEKLDRAILLAPAGRLVPVALGHLRRGGSLAIAAIYLDPIPSIDYGEILYGERSVTSVTASTRQDARELLELAGEIPIEVEVREFPLEDANRALEALKRSAIPAAGVLRVP